jgi:hypothetical protein
MPAFLDAEKTELRRDVICLNQQLLYVAFYHISNHWQAQFPFVSNDYGW